MVAVPTLDYEPLTIFLKWLNIGRKTGRASLLSVLSPSCNYDNQKTVGVEDYDEYSDNNG